MAKRRRGFGALPGLISEEDYDKYSLTGKYRLKKLDTIAGSGEYQTEVLRGLRGDKDRPIERLRVGTAAVTEGRAVYGIVKPILLGALLIFFLVGPGISAVMAIFGALNIWVWLGILVMALLIWRNR